MVKSMGFSSGKVLDLRPAWPFTGHTALARTLGFPRSKGPRLKTGTGCDLGRLVASDRGFCVRQGHGTLPQGDPTVCLSVPEEALHVSSRSGRAHGITVTVYGPFCIFYNF